jgi:PAS domain S-box-containing protein
MISMINRDSFHAKHTIRRIRLIFWSVICVLIMLNIGAIVDSVLHPEIEYFDTEHIIVGLTTASIVGIILIILYFYIERLEKAFREIHASEETLQENEEKFKHVFDLSVMGKSITQLSGEIDVNQATCDMLGYSREELKNRKWSEFTHPDDVELTQNEVKLLTSGQKEKTHFIKRFIHKNGSIVWVELGTSVYRDQNGKPLYIISTLNDITERIRAEKITREFTSNNPMSIQILDKDGFTLEVNPAFKLLFGSVPPADYSIFNDIQLAEKGMGKIFDQLRNGGIVQFPDANFNVHDSRPELPDVPVWVKTIGFPLYGSDEKLVRFVLMHENITERKRAEQILQQQNQYLTALQNTMLELASQLDLKILLENIVKRASALMGTNAGLIDLVDPATDQLIPQVGVGILEESLHLPVQPGEGLTGIVWQTGEMLVIPIYDQWSERLDRFSYGKLGSVIGMPLLSGTDVLGVLVIASEHASPHLFSPDAIEILNQFARLATVAVQNARLFSNLQTELVERMQAEDEMRESEEQYRTLFQQASDGIFYLNTDLEVQMVNEAFARMHGYNVEEMKGVRLQDLDTPESLRLSPERIARVLAGEFIEFEVEHFHKDGHTFPLAVSTGMITIRGQKLIQAFHRDITERKRTEQAMQASERTAHRMADQLEIANQIGLKITAGLDFEQLINTIFEQCQLIGDTDTFYVALYDHITGMLSFPFFHKDGEFQNIAARNIKDTPGLTGHIIESRQTLYIPDQSNNLPAGLTAIRHPGPLTRSFIGVPLIVNDRVVGVLSMQSNSLNAYSPDQIKMLELVATQVAIAIQNSQLYSQVRQELAERSLAEEALQVSEQTAQRMAEKLKMVNQIGLKITAGLDFEQLMQTIYEQIQQIGYANTFYIALYDAASGELNFPFYYSNDERAVRPSLNLRENPGIASHVIENRQTIYIPDIHNLPAGITPVTISPSPSLTRSYLGIPLILSERVIGLLSMQSVNSNAYSPEKIQMLELLAVQVAITIQNSQLYERVRQELTERKRIEQEILQLNASLEQRVEERTHELRETQEQLVRKEKLAILGLLAGSVGHELRNPLGVINTSIYYLDLVQPQVDEKIKKHHAMIEQEVRNADKIITDLLDFARNITAEQELVSVPDLVQRTLERFPVPATVKLTLNLPADLPQVFVDPRQMGQVLSNLTTNACQAMSDVGQLTISARLQDPVPAQGLKKKMVVLSIKDTGSGITAENMKKIFEPLFTTKTKGIGLGLAVSRKLIEANRGRIEVESEPGQGCMFRLYLPVEEE